MKFSKLLVLSAMLASVSNAWAVLIDREEPAAPDSYEINMETLGKTATDFVAGDVYALYNVGTLRFFIAGSDWSTRATVGESAALVRFVVTDAAKALGDGVYELKNYVADKKEVRSAFYDPSNNTIWTDNNSENNRWWKIAGTKDAYQIFNTADADKVMGWDGADTDYRLFLVDPTEAGDNAKWQLFAVPEWTNYYKQKDVYDAATELREILENNVPDGMNVAAYEAVYNNLNATLEQIKAAIEQLNQAIKDFASDEINKATGENPVDITAFIQNPSYDKNNNEGWSGSTPAFQSYTDAEFFYDKDQATKVNKTFHYYQDITSIPTGVYAVDVQAFYRAGSAAEAYEAWPKGENLNAKVFARGLNETDSLFKSLANIFDGGAEESIGKGSEATGGKLRVPNNMEAAEAYFVAGRYHNTLFFDVTGGDALRIGLAKGQGIQHDWTLFDNWTLKYYGKGADAYKAWAKSAAGLFSFDNVDYYTNTVKENYEALVASADATNRAEALAFIAQIEAALPEVRANVEAWNAYYTKVLEGRALIQTIGKDVNDAATSLNSYLTNQRTGAGRILSAHALTTEQVIEETAKLELLIEAAKMGAPAPGTDVTYRLTNPDFSTGDWTGWEKEAASGGNVAVSESCAEAFNNASFNIRQEVAEMPVGVYEISVQGFYRYLRAENAWNAWQAKTEAYVNESPTYIYMNENRTPFKNIFSEVVLKSENFYTGDYNTFADGEGTEYVFPNNMADAAKAFAKGMYTQSAFGAVLSAEDVMKLGVKGSSNQGNDSWVIFDNFKLTFWGTQADKVVEALTAAIVECVDIVENNTTMPAAVMNNFQAAINAAEKVLNEQPEDGEALFAALGTLYAAKNSIYEMAEKFEELASLVQTVYADWESLTTSGYLSTIADNYVTRIQEISEALNEGQVGLDDVEGLMEELKGMQEVKKQYEELLAATLALQDAIDVTTNQEWAIEAQALVDVILGGLQNTTIKPTQIEENLVKVREMTTKENLHADDMASATDEEPYDATELIKTPNFSALNDESEEVASQEGWSGTEGGWGQSGQEAFMALEFFNKNFDKYQEFYGLPNGVYEVGVQAFYRFGANAAEDYSKFTDKRTGHAFIYAQTGLTADTLTSSAPIALLSQYATEDTVKVAHQEIVDDDYVTVYKPSGAISIIEYTNEASVKDTLYVPNQPSTATDYFAQGYYKNRVLVKVTDGSLRIGVKKNVTVTNDWFIMDNWTLTYYGATSTKEADENPMIIKGIADDDAEVVRTEFFTLNGMRTASLQKGIVIMRQTLSNGNVIVKKLNQK